MLVVLNHGAGEHDKAEAEDHPEQRTPQAVCHTFVD
jgi:hypothetical protein